MATCLWKYVVTLWGRVGEVLAMNALQEEEVSCVTVFELRDRFCSIV